MVPCTWTALAVLALHAAVGGGHLVPRASRAPIGTASRIVMMPRSMRPREARKAVKREWRSKRFEESELALAQISSNRSATSRAGETLRAPRRMRGVDLTQGVDRRTRSDLKLYITGGEQKGRKLRTPAVYIRPMMAQVREAMFSMLGDLVELGPSASALDLFSGSGCVGLETLSRGCERVASVDLSADCVDVMRANARMCGYEERHVAVCARAEAVLAEPTKYGLSPPFDLITLTPPYEEIVYSELMDAILASPAVGENTVVAIEYPEELGVMPSTLGEGRLVGYRNRRYGRTVLAVYVYRPDGSQGVLPHPHEFM